MQGFDPDDPDDKVRALLVAGRLREEYVAAGKEELFEELKGFILWSGPARSDKEFQEKLNLSYGAFKIAVHRLRRRYVELLRNEFGNDSAE